MIDGVHPDRGDPSGSASPTTFAFKVEYTDPGGGAPSSATCRIEYKQNGTTWVSQADLAMTLESGDVSTGAVFACSTQLPNEVLRYRFAFEDENGRGVGGAPAVFRAGHPLINGVPRLAWTGKPGYGTDGVEPNSGALGTKFVFRVRYYDSAGDAPITSRLQVLRDGNPFRDKQLFTGANGHLKFGKVYGTSVILTKPGAYEYRFVFEDGSGAATDTPAQWQSAPGITATGGATVASLAAVPTAAGAQFTFCLSGAANVTATIVNIAGRPIRSLVTDRPLGAGLQTLAWDRRAETGLPVPSGLYLIRVTARSADGSQSQATTALPLR